MVGGLVHTLKLAFCRVINDDNIAITNRERFLKPGMSNHPSSSSNAFLNGQITRSFCGSPIAATEEMQEPRIQDSLWSIVKASTLARRSNLDIYSIKTLMFMLGYLVSGFQVGPCHQ